jgi:hypothetical protein
MISGPQLQQTDSDTESASRRGTMPGALPAVAGVALSAALCWVWLGNGSDRAASAASSATVSELSEVNELVIPDALTTMVGSTAFLAQFKDDSSKCRQPLAWVSAEAAPGAKPTAIRLRSGSYISPVFTLSTRPVRIAIPYPAPYEAGHGSLTIIGATNKTVIALSPPWRSPEGASQAIVQVHWVPTKTCGSGYG